MEFEVDALIISFKNFIMIAVCCLKSNTHKSLEQLRFLSMGFGIGAMAVDAVPFEVNTAKDYEEALALNPE